MKQVGIPFFVCAILFSAAAVAQQGEDVYADPQNLKVLPEDISSKDLSDTMKGFAMGLGARCETCHVGEPDTPLTTFDFASDEKEMKEKARVMLAMVQDINSVYVPRLNEVEESEVEESQRVEVRCVTCHRGQPQPKLIEDVLDEQLASDGIDAAIAKYAELRDEYYGSHSYDFSEFTIPLYAQGVAGSGNKQAALALAKVNAENFPESYYTYFLIAELYRSDSQGDLAIENYRKAIELNPEAAPFLESRISELSSD